MSHYLPLIAFLASSICSFAQHTISWGPATVVAEGATYGGVRPRIALTSDNVPIVLFGKSGNGELRVARWTGSSFAAPVDLLPNGMGSYLASWTGPDIAAHGDTVVAVFKALPFEEGKVYAVRSVDGGMTFSDTIRVDDHSEGRVFMPALAMDSDGNPSMNYMVFNGSSGDPRWTVAKSVDGGLTYGPGQGVSLSVPGEACDCCPAEMVVNGSRHVLLFRNNLSNIRDIHAVLSVDGGATFVFDDNVEGLSWNVNTCPSTGPHGIIAGDSLFTVSASKASGSYRVYISSASVDGGLTSYQQFSPPPPASVNGSQNYPRISGENDTLVLVWEEKESSNADIFCAVVTDGNISGFAEYKSRVNTITPMTQTNPDIVYRDGFAHIVYQDNTLGEIIYHKGTVIGVAAVEEFAAPGVTVYPNPSPSGVFTVGGISNGELRATVTDLSGKTVESTLQKTPQGWEIAVDAAAGIYTLLLEEGSGMRAQSQLIIRN